ncbi:MAG: hypothetical protein ACREOW_10190 [Thermodesulfobacteriota bacterium]
MSEKDYYEAVKKEFEDLFNTKGETYLEITANKTFSNKLKKEIPDYRHIIFYFLKEVAPDISGFIKRKYGTEFIVIEVKDEVLKLDHIYQSRKYAELFDARFVFLVSTQEIPEEIKRLSRVVYSLLSLPASRKLILVQFNADANQFVEWFEENPFEKEIHWK